ncbi:DedA family protein [Brevundimonas aveniformis]|uniref:DedA family protein n=1 Tax=Brevundimonas aveniformis TaxID=370977 RepID=UPI000423AD84|nr:DedA family protein [Brevundimonas aveniformis]
MDSIFSFFADLWAPISAFFDGLGELIRDNSAWAGPILGLITFGESMVLIGAFFPATALMLIAGGLAAEGSVSIVEVLLWCVAGAFLGDAVSYWLGRKLGPAAWRSRLLRNQRRLAARSRLFFRRWGVLSIYLCRFMGPVRAFVPLIAGITGMPHLKFQLANFGSAAVWVPIMLAPGYLGGLGLQWLNQYEHGLEYGMAILAVLIVLFLVARGALKARAERALGLAEE